MQLITKWISKDGTVSRTIPVTKREISVNLPFDPLAITQVLAEKWDRMPVVPLAIARQTLSLGKPARVLISGAELWRRPQVTIGAQMAKSVIVLPGMRGVIATFDDLTGDGANERDTKGNKIAEIAIWTSTGSYRVGEAILEQTGDSP